MVTKYEEAMKGRGASYNELVVGIKQITQVTKANDASYRELVGYITDSRKDGENMAMKWIQEQNPNANFNEVSSMYKQLVRFMESKRANFVSVEANLGSIDAEHKRLIRPFPNNLYAKFFGISELGYEPITTSAVKEANKSGVDNDIDLDL